MLIGLSALLFITVVIIALTKSNFGNLNPLAILNNNYNTRGCSYDNREVPEGKVPGSYLGLSEVEKNQLLRNFVNDNPYKRT
jgi:hypothetical protein